MNARRTALAVLVLAGPICFGTPAFAHAFLERASPPVGSELPVSPKAVTITFTEGVEPDFSTIEVQNAQGARVDRSDLHMIGDEGRQLSVSLPSLPPGSYTVIWHATSVDTHKTEGRFNFTVTP